MIQNQKNGDFLLANSRFVAVKNTILLEQFYVFFEAFYPFLFLLPLQSGQKRVYDSLVIVQYSIESENRLYWGSNEQKPATFYTNQNHK